MRLQYLQVEMSRYLEEKAGDGMDWPGRGTPEVMREVKFLLIKTDGLMGEEDSME